MEIPIRDVKVGTKILCEINGKLEIVTKRKKWNSNQYEYCGMRNGICRTIYPYIEVLEGKICILVYGNGKDLTDTKEDNEKDFELLENYLKIAFKCRF